jgi:hypothetical protein
MPDISLIAAILTCLSVLYDFTIRLYAFLKKPVNPTLFTNESV